MKLQYFRLLAKILTLGCIGFTGCQATMQGLVLEGKPGICAQQDAAISSEGYYNQIKPEDELLIKELQGSNTVFSTDRNLFRVDADNNISLPVLGKVKVGGLTRQQASEKINMLYGEKEILAPVIEVTITNMHVTILGEVMKQGNYPIVREDYALIDLLGDAQGFSSNANTEKVKITRKVGQTWLTMNSSNATRHRELTLKSGDLIYVPSKPWAAKMKSMQQYTGLIQLGLVLISTLAIAFNR